jgi:hypothetical protein
MIRKTVIEGAAGKHNHASRTVRRASLLTLQHAPLEEPQPVYFLNVVNTSQTRVTRRRSKALMADMLFLAQTILARMKHVAV